VCGQQCCNFLAPLVSHEINCLGLLISGLFAEKDWLFVHCEGELKTGEGGSTRPQNGNRTTFRPT
jgi:hypothetical protein